VLVQKQGTGVYKLFSQDDDLVYCCNIPRLMQKFGVDYKVNEWRLSLTLAKEA
jgi:hypothetical protein